mmetsp:Transcript_21864/g.30903  ORF Transcript_21864/g.30903 Transcript_21864/m.30903 type:complete len:206 (+) Transcript_21864:746-1363(+)
MRCPITSVVASLVRSITITKIFDCEEKVGGRDVHLVIFCGVIVQQNRKNSRFRSALTGWENFHHNFTPTQPCRQKICQQRVHRCGRIAVSKYGRTDVVGRHHNHFVHFVSRRPNVNHDKIQVVALGQLVHQILEDGHGPNRILLLAWYFDSVYRCGDLASDGVPLVAPFHQQKVSIRERVFVDLNHGFFDIFFPILFVVKPLPQT